MTANSISENLKMWDEVHEWAEDGDEWKGQSRCCGVPYEEWKQSLIDHLIVPYVKQGDAVLEIAPGHGRWTGPLAERAGRLVLVDLSPSCLDYCAKRFADISRANVNRRFAIVLDDKVISAPVIREPITGGRGQISGSFTAATASELAVLLRAGALPAPLTVVEERSVGPELGADSIRAGAISLAVGFLFVVAFMGVFYGLFGWFANIALLVNVMLMLAIMSVIGATLTLPGMAGILLTLGVAVDANILVNERIREEFRAGRPPLSALEHGFSRAFSTIFDSNAAAFLSHVMLFAFGSGPVRGFAVTITIGIATTLFTNWMLTRLLVGTWYIRTRPKTLPV